MSSRQSFSIASSLPGALYRSLGPVADDAKRPPRATSAGDIMTGDDTAQRRVEGGGSG